MKNISKLAVIFILVALLVSSVMGCTGEQGASGIDGTTWHNGTGAPIGSLGIVGDYYLDIVSGDVYEKTGVSIWEHLVTFAIAQPQPTLSVSDAAPVPEGGDAVFTVTLSSPSSLPVTFNYSTADGAATAGSDYAAISGHLVTIPPGETSVDFDISVFDDTYAESSEDFNVSIINPTNATLSDDQGVGTILDND